MKSTLFACLLILQLSFSEHLVCLSDSPTTQLRLAQLSVKQNTQYNFQLSFHPAPVNILRNSNGTFFQGDFSLLQLQKDNRTHVYRSNGFSFKYPPQHRIADVSNEILELQITYSLQENSQIAWKHKQLVLSISFMCSEYLPVERRTLGKLINFRLNNGSQLDLGSALPLVSGMNMLLYKGTHSADPSDAAVLWLVRKELLLISEEELEEIREFIYQHTPKEELQYHGLLSKNSDLNEIAPYFD